MVTAAVELVLVLKTSAWGGGEGTGRDGVGEGSGRTCGGGDEGSRRCVCCSSGGICLKRKKSCVQLDYFMP